MRTHHGAAQQRAIKALQIPGQVDDADPLLGVHLQRGRAKLNVKVQHAQRRCIPLAANRSGTLNSQTRRSHTAAASGLAWRLISKVTVLVAMIPFN